MNLYTAAKIVAGIVLFMIIIAISFWYGKGKTLPQPAPGLDTPAIAQLKEIRCVEDTKYMRANHMKLLAMWRESAVRDGNRHYTATDGRIFEAKLSGTCLKCHSNKEQFCDRCHNYLGAKPNCFSCHIIPGEVK